MIDSDLFCEADPVKVDYHRKCVKRYDTMLSPERSLLGTFKDQYIKYVVALSQIDERPELLASVCEPSFHRRLTSAWAELKTASQGQAKIELLNARQGGYANYFKLSAVSAQIHHGVYLDRDEDMRSQTELVSSDGLRYHYK